MSSTTTSPPASTPLRAVPETLGVLGAGALSEIVRSATLAQNLAAATRLEAAHCLVESLGRIDTDPESGIDPSRRPSYARLDPADRARDHLSAALTLTTWHAARLVTAGVQIHTRLPLLRKAVARGLFPEQLAIDAACRLAEIPDEVLRGVESHVVGQLARDLDGGHRPSRAALDNLVDTARERLDPGGLEDAVDDAVENRTVRFRPERNGMASMWARLPVGDAEKLRRRIDAVARDAHEAGHPRTRDQLRADALCALGDPTTDEIGGLLHDPESPRTDAPTGAPWATSEPIRISIIDGTAQGLPNRVQFVNGAYSSFDWLCEELLKAGDARVRFELLDPQPGVLDTPDALLKYFITPALAERIRLRDGTCRHPGCTVDARDCDVDHVLAFNLQQPELGGPTAEWNLVCLCRKHHREKTFGHSAYSPGPLGELTLITETGHVHRTTPSGPLARARDQILDHAWREHLDTFIADDGHLTNPPGVDRPGPRGHPA